MSELNDCVGNRISVISKSQERFEGILRAIDSNAQTVTLTIDALTEGKRSTAHAFPLTFQRLSYS